MPLMPITSTSTREGACTVDLEYTTGTNKVTALVVTNSTGKTIMLKLMRPGKAVESYTLPPTGTQVRTVLASNYLTFTLDAVGDATNRPSSQIWGA